MSNPNDPQPKRGRGRPKGSAKPPKPPSPMGRPSAWHKEHGKCAYHQIAAPERFFVLFKNPEFKKAISKLMLEFK